MDRRLKDCLATDLRAALDQDTLQLLFQPKVDVFTEIATGAEVFLHWIHPTEGVIPAEKWLEVAAEANLLRDITYWTLKATIKKLEATPDSQLVLSVNIPPSVLDDAFLRTLRRMLKNLRINPSRLELEITEQEAIVDLKQVARVIDDVHDLGVQVSLDDFGAGFSTMQYLVHLSVDTVKIDQSFVQQAPNLASARLVLGALIDLAKEIGVKVVCEGVETQEQLSLVTKMGANQVQGYLFGRPMPMIDAGWLGSNLKSVDEPFYVAIGNA